MTGHAGEGFDARLHRVGEQRWHDTPPFHQWLHACQCVIDQVRAWVINRDALQRTPMQKTTFLSGAEHHRPRRIWRHGIEDHDATSKMTGGIARWLKLVAGVGLGPDHVRTAQGVPPCHAAATIPSPRHANATGQSLSDIWQDHPAFTAFKGTDRMAPLFQGSAWRDADLGGWRCQAMALAGDAAAPDQVCRTSPARVKVNARRGVAPSDAPCVRRACEE